MTAVTAKPLTLESGDRLTQAEFHRRYLASTRIKRAELVEGVVYVTGRVTAMHGEAHAAAIGWLGNYWSRHPDLHLMTAGTVILDVDNEVQPDAFLWREEPGGPHLNADGYVQGAPQLVVEAALSSASYDLHDKLRAYERNGVREYVVWRVADGAIDWFRLGEGAYERVEPDAAGLIESTTFPGLRLHVAKMLGGDLAGVLAELETRPSP
jgi:Uma2 family endonuclease